MSRLILDPEIKAKLHGLREQMELCDPDGHTMGRYLPEDLYQKLLYRLAESQRPFLTPQEIDQRRHETGGKPLAEILQRLRSS